MTASLLARRMERYVAWSFDDDALAPVRGGARGRRRGRKAVPKAGSGAVEAAPMDRGPERHSRESVRERRRAQSRTAQLRQKALRKLVSVGMGS